MVNLNRKEIVSTEKAKTGMLETYTSGQSLINGKNKSITFAWTKVKVGDKILLQQKLIMLLAEHVAHHQVYSLRAPHPTCTTP
jgi:hypothetical protein